MPAWAGRVDELRREGLDPAIDRHVIDGDAALGEQLLNIAIGQAVAQVPPHRDSNHLTREAVARRSRRRRRPRIDHRLSVSDAGWAPQRNSAGRHNPDAITVLAPGLSRDRAARRGRRRSVGTSDVSRRNSLRVRPSVPSGSRPSGLTHAAAGRGDLELHDLGRVGEVPPYADLLTRIPL